MSGIFSTLNIASKGLIAQQTALSTTAHNISNANTEGFSRQRVDLKSDIAFNFAGVGQLGTGVKMDSIVRMVDDYINIQIRKENATFQRFTAKSDILDQLEIIFNEPSDSGLNFNIGELFNAWQELSKNPESLNSKTIVVEKAKTFADTLNHMSDQMNSLRDETISDVQKDVYDFNTIVDKIDTLNKQIYNIAVKGQIPNDLLDQQDLLLQNLSSLTHFETEYDQFGRVSIAIGGENILSQGSRADMSIISDIQFNGTDYTVSVYRGGDNTVVDTFTTANSDDFYAGQIVLTDKDAAALVPTEIVADPSMTSGKIIGKMEALGEVQERMDSLDNYAKVLASAINEIHHYDGTDATQGINFFTDANGNDVVTAADIQVNPDIIGDESKVNAAYDSMSPEGDGSRALAISRLKGIKINFSNDGNDIINFQPDTLELTSIASGTTIEQAYQDMVIRVGISKEHADNMVDNQEVLLNQLTLRKESVSGVSLDEEVTNMIKFQKAYEANAKVISVLTEMLDTLINRTGV
ncbi:MAG: flagellar hook-associated protein FlgK [Eubacteriales bacterium]